MKISDKAFGYISFGAIICMITGVGIGMWHAHRETSSQAVIDFDELGALSPEDPVTESGYEIGHIGSVEWLGDRSRVTVVFDEPVTLREGTRFRNAAFALMGGRRIELIRPRTGEALPKDYVFRGEFVPGITESLRFISDIRDQALNMQKIVEAILSGTDSTPGVVQKFNEAEQALESLLENLETTAKFGDEKLRGVLDQATVASETIERTANTADSVFHTVNVQAKSSIESAKSGLENLSQGISRIDSLVRAVESSEAGKSLLAEKELIETVQEAVSKMQALIQAVNTKDITVYDENGNRVKLVRWKNLNIIGKTAREKARERQKKSAENP